MCDYVDVIFYQHFVVVLLVSWAVVFVFCFFFIVCLFVEVSRYGQLTVRFGAVQKALGSVLYNCFKLVVKNTILARVHKEL